MGLLQLSGRSCDYDNSWDEHMWSGSRACWKGDWMTQVTLLLAFTPPSVNTTLAGLLLHWHALGCAFALVSNHDIWLLSRAVQMLCCWIKHEAFPLFGFSHTVKWSFMDYVPSTYECNSGHRRCLFSAAVVSIVASQQGSWSRISSHGEWMFYKEMHAIILIIDSSVCESTRHFIDCTPNK